MSNLTWQLTPTLETAGLDQSKSSPPQPQVGLFRLSKCLKSELSCRLKRHFNDPLPACLHLRLSGSWSTGTLFAFKTLSLFSLAGNNPVMNGWSVTASVRACSTAAAPDSGSVYQPSSHWPSGLLGCRACSSAGCYAPAWDDLSGSSAHLAVPCLSGLYVSSLLFGSSPVPTSSLSPFIMLLCCLSISPDSLVAVCFCLSGQSCCS